MTSSWFFLSTLNYDARSATHQIYVSCSVQGSWFCGCAKLYINTANAELNTISHLLALLGPRHILHVSRIMVKGPFQLRFHIAHNAIRAQQNGLDKHLGGGRYECRPILVCPSRILVVFFLSCAIVGPGKTLKFPSDFVLKSRLKRLTGLVTSCVRTAI